jgi:hypothetical protein
MTAILNTLTYKKATKDQTLVAIVFRIKELPKYLYQKEADFLFRSRAM